MISNIIKTIEENNMFELRDKVIVGVSGGPDSMCLLHILNKLKNKYELTLSVAHINHCLRGKEADEDEEYVKEFCNKIGIKCYTLRIDVDKISKEKNLSCEMAGRKVRYDFFEKIRQETNAQKIALAHNANDQAETVIMRIIRGTGLEGMIGIRPIRGGVYVRPLINTTRKEIERYCKENSINPRIDKTNLETIYTRNKIRLELIPYIEKNFNTDIVNTINRFSNTLKKDEEYLEKISCEKFKKYSAKKNQKVIIYKEAFDESEAILTRIIRKSLNDISGNTYNFEKKHIYEIINLQKKSTGKGINLTNNIFAYNNYGNISLSKNSKKDTNINEEYNIIVNGTTKIKDFKLSVDANVISSKQKIDFNKEEATKYFDYDKIKKQIIIRYRKNGDIFTPLGMKGSKKVKDLFIDLKIPKEERDRIPFICFGDEIAWIVGFRVSDKFKIDKNTKNILRITIERED